MKFPLVLLFLKIWRQKGQIYFKNSSIQVVVLTFVRDWHYFMFCIRMLENTFGAEHLLVTLAEEFHLFVLVSVTVLNASILLSTCSSSARR
jgi:hypothetical protein